ncbi:1-acyl-sn-glycerol-3-phosphate acyltransferase [Rubellimicrobium mesophilum DSM 19309]|uniref:1-acyl-sn-glycerol-3-phosphate acyltransferase n=1 Tax=Rubellimicrobium mesophilum DSM 19309 TaxID=442562 RepID=A0A017HBA7_9RHOB|nr:lysophospholipid acyltransferase family protein [Rubellimicrobium mesophilum]EYD71575.1 1-acyl-sn-glycerol-3-phosphate acyltransferase [Rubellimicrobium mesophilum DSM 19309]
MPGNPLRRLAARVAGHGIVLACKAVTAVRADWRGVPPEPRQRVYFANHTSNADMPMIWSVLPPELRDRTRPVAAADYWLESRARAFFGAEVFRGVLIDRRPEARIDNPMEAILRALDEGSSLIIFPEGRRNAGPDPLLPFKSGLYNIGVARPAVELVPTWIANLNAIMPKGEVVPLPLIATVTFGAPLRVAEGEDKDAFLDRAAQALLDLREAA